MNSFQEFGKKAMDFYFRRRSPALTISKLGGTIVVASIVGGIVVNTQYADSSHAFQFSFISSDTSAVLGYASFILGAALCLGGSIWEYRKYTDEVKRLSNKRVISIEQRGLVNASDSPISSFIQAKHIGKQIDSIVTDIRDNFVNGAVTRPAPALQKILALENSIEERRNQIGAEDIEIVYGGLVPVPFAFLTGYLVDDESKLEVIDWDRQISSWRHLNEDDDGESFSVEDFNQNYQSNEAVITISFSYPVDTAGINNSFPNLPQVQLKLNNQRFDNHWSKEKQDRLSSEYIEIVKSLMTNGIEHVHLVLACQNSVAFRFGQAYDRRNLPPITVYQYERSNVNRYPWGVHIPQSHHLSPQVINNNVPIVGEKVGKTINLHPVI